MSVGWLSPKGADDWPTIAWVVACPACNAAPGTPCQHTPAEHSHTIRLEIARTLGFYWYDPLPLFDGAP